MTEGGAVSLMATFLPARMAVARRSTGGIYTLPVLMAFGGGYNVRLSVKGRALDIHPAFLGTVKLTNRHPSGSFGGLNRGVRDGRWSADPARARRVYVLPTIGDAGVRGRDLPAGEKSAT